MLPVILFGAWLLMYPSFGEDGKPLAASRAVALPSGKIVKVSENMPPVSQTSWVQVSAHDSAKECEEAHTALVSLKREDMKGEDGSTPAPHLVRAARCVPSDYIYPSGRGESENGKPVPSREEVDAALRRLGLSDGSHVDRSRLQWLWDAWAGATASPPTKVSAASSDPQRRTLADELANQVNAGTLTIEEANWRLSHGASTATAKPKVLPDGSHDLGDGFTWKEQKPGSGTSAPTEEKLRAMEKQLGLVE